MTQMPFSVDAEIVCDAMIAADAYGRAFREAQHDPAVPGQLGWAVA